MGKNEFIFNENPGSFFGTKVDSTVVNILDLCEWTSIFVFKESNINSQIDIFCLIRQHATKTWYYLGNFYIIK